MSTVHKELHSVIEKLQEKDAESLLQLLKKIIRSYRQYPVSDEELNESEIMEIEVAKSEIARGEYVDFEDLKLEYGL